MILVMKSSSMNCMGWEGNEFDIEEFDGNLREFVLQDLDIDEESEEYIEEVMSGESYENHGFGVHPHGSEEDGYHYEGEEVSVSFTIFEPTQEFVDMLQRYVK